MAVKVDTCGTICILPILSARFFSVSPRFVNVSRFGMSLFAAKDKTRESAWNNAGSVKAPLDTDSMPWKKICPASPTQKTGSPACLAASDDGIRRVQGERDTHTMSHQHS
jgi:hypothetical protein